MEIQAWNHLQVIKLPIEVFHHYDKEQGGNKTPLPKTSMSLHHICVYAINVELRTYNFNCIHYPSSEPAGACGLAGWVGPIFTALPAGMQKEILEGFKHMLYLMNDTRMSSRFARSLPLHMSSQSYRQCKLLGFTPSVLRIQHPLAFGWWHMRSLV